MVENYSGSQQAQEPEESKNLNTGNDDDTSGLPTIKGVNRAFWHQFGNPNDAEAISHDSKLFIIRHALSNGNIYWDD